MPALNISNIKDAKLGSTELSAVYKGCTQIWRADNVITKCHSLSQRILADGKYKYEWLSYNDDAWANPFEAEFLVGDEWQSRPAPNNIRGHRPSMALSIMGTKYGPSPQEQPLRYEFDCLVHHSAGLEWM